MSTATAMSWTEANHTYLVAEFARLKERLGMTAMLASGIPEPQDSPFAIDRLTAMFGLTDFERDLLLLCAGVEMDSELAARCAEMHQLSQRPYVTFGLAMSLLENPHWSAFTPVRPLRRFHLVELSNSGGFATAPVRIDERVLHYLAGMHVPDPSLNSLITPIAGAPLVAEEHRNTATSIARILREASQVAPVLHLCGDDAFGQEDVAALVTQALGLELFSIRLEDLPGSTQDLERLVWLLEREALLLPATFLLQCGNSSMTAAANYLADKLPFSFFLATQEPVRLHRAYARFDVNKPAAREQHDLWVRALNGAASNMNGGLARISQQFRLSARMIYHTGMLASTNSAELNPDTLWKACRSLARPKLEDLAQRISPAATWGDIVLPELQMRMLRHMSTQAWHRMRVHEHWGFAGKGKRGLGVSALFCGESGTGKTLAAEVLASELGLDLYRIDLASVVSKYIGETEKNLKIIFDAAEEGGVLLLFDEADALFGKRGEVKDSHDRYANIEVGYLLQRMESYAGLAVLTTNLKASLDRAFQRRLRFTITFPFPDAAQREAIWAKVFPSSTPTRGLDMKKLSQLNVAGGNIRNIALNAAFLAADCDGPVGMEHLLEAAKLEAHKIERPLAGAELRGWV
ncbi:AAA ATPase [Candidatus Koribacter versatilis Ellin345]|uniref:AAA ATPase n=1 Tax=Koribacter versatilis (strain Ellin345) TaxID=204669 RepID=Q1ITD6_KORVE|nr:ATP-binding protein [Candidatus Koribacter versatilis]ABF39864.1 AAA ATPase [Candidatus Koribacter versatilis Ellin345]